MPKKQGYKLTFNVKKRVGKTNRVRNQKVASVRTFKTRSSAVSRKRGLDRGLARFGSTSGTRVVKNTGAVRRLPKKRLKSQFE